MELYEGKIPEYDKEKRTQNCGLMQVMLSVRGVGKAAANYMFMLAGDPSRCKPDTHIRCFVRNACGHDLSDDEIQELFTDTVKELRIKHPNLTVRMLDGIIWRKLSSN